MEVQQWGCSWNRVSLSDASHLVSTMSRKPIPVKIENSLFELTDMPQAPVRSSKILRISTILSRTHLLGTRMQMFSSSTSPLALVSVIQRMVR